MADETDTMEMADSELQAAIQDLRETLFYQNGLVDGTARARDYVLNAASVLFRRASHDDEAREVRAVAMEMEEVVKPLISQRNTTQHNMDSLKRELERRRRAEANG